MSTSRKSARRIKALIKAVERKTGSNFAELTSAVQELCDGYENIVSSGVSTVDDSVLESGSRLIAMLSFINTITGISHTNLTAAIQTLVDGYSSPSSAFLYSFGALSDTHIQYTTGADDLRRALPYLDDKVDFNCICGDLVWCATAEYMAEYKAIISDTALTTKPVYECTGNHESYPANATTGLVDKSLWEDTTGWAGHTDCVGDSMYYYFVRGNDVFIMFSLLTDDPMTFPDGALDWLKEVLEANRNKRCFVFQHIHDPSDATADPSGTYSPILDKGDDGVLFLKLLKHYANAIWFHGHTHLSLTTERDGYKPVSTARGYKSVHIPSLQGVRYWNDGDTALQTSYETVNESGTTITVQGGAHSEGYIVDVYDNKIVLRGIDFAVHYYNADWTSRYEVEPMEDKVFTLNTTLRSIEAGTFVE